MVKIKSSSNSCSWPSPPVELLRIAIEQIQACEIDKFRNLNKLAILVNLISSLLRVSLVRVPSSPSASGGGGHVRAAMLANMDVFVQLMKSLVQIINTFNVGRGGLSLSFMGNFITKSAHVSLLELVQLCMSGDTATTTTTTTTTAVDDHDEDGETTTSKEQIDCDERIVRTLLSTTSTTTDTTTTTTWLVPLMLHREPQIRSITFSLMAVLIRAPLARTKLLAHESGLWSLALNVLLNRNESSVVRMQSCSFLTNLTRCMLNTADSMDSGLKRSSAASSSSSSAAAACKKAMSCKRLQLILVELDFYKRIAVTLSTFYPYAGYSLGAIMKQSRLHHDGDDNDNQNDNNDNNDNDDDEVSICSPLLVASICELLYNLSVLLDAGALMPLIKQSGTLGLLASYMKPASLLSCDTGAQHSLHDELVEMLCMVCKYLNLCCRADPECMLIVLTRNNNIINSLNNSSSSSSGQKSNTFVLDAINSLGIRSSKKGLFLDTRIFPTTKF